MHNAKREDCNLFKTKIMLTKNNKISSDYHLITEYSDYDDMLGCKDNLFDVEGNTKIRNMGRNTLVKYVEQYLIVNSTA